MTKKHFELVAKTISNRANAIEYSSADDNQKSYALFELLNLMLNFADEFELVNENFNRSTFFNACQPLTELHNKYRTDIMLNNVWFDKSNIREVKQKTRLKISLNAIKKLKDSLNFWGVFFLAEMDLNRCILSPGISKYGS